MKIHIGKRDILWAALFIAVCAVFFTILTELMKTIWGFDLFHPAGDVFGYWKESLTWGLPFHPHHPPGYPVLIAIARSVLGGWLTPLQIMQGLSFLFLTGGALLLVQIDREEENLTPRYWGAFLFISWPFVGSLYAVFPQIDACVLFLIILGIVLCRKNHWIWGGACWGLAMWIHPFAWIIGPTLLLLPVSFWYLRRKSMDTKRKGLTGWQVAGVILVTLAPIFLLWLWQTVVTQDPLWTLSSILGEQVASRGTAPFLDGWIGTSLNPGIGSWIKIIILALIVMLAGYCGISALTEKVTYSDTSSHFRRGISVIVSGIILLMAAVLNQHEIWAVARFSKILIIPLLLNRQRLWGFIPTKIITPAMMVIIVGGFVTQMIYAWYMTDVFFGE